MKKSLSKVSFISILAIIICGSAFGVPPPPPPPPAIYPCPHVPNYYSPGEYVERCSVYICSMGHYCPGSGDAGTTLTYNLEPCPDNYDNTATGLTSIEECCLNGYDENTGLCVESSDPTPSRVPGRIAKDDTNPVCDDTTLGTASGSTDFEADWKPNEISITWDDNGATTESTGGVDKCTYDKSFELPTPPERTGYTFDGWKVVNK